MAHDDLIKLQSPRLSCTIAICGAELLSLCDETARDEFIWQRDPAYWAASAPILFPVIGRMKDGGYVLDQQFYEIPKHGFARDLDFAVVVADESNATFRLTDNARTIANFPFAFALEVKFSLQASTLTVDYHVENRSMRVMPFALGSHPAFALPVESGGIEDWSIVFSESEAPLYHRVTENLLSSTPAPFIFSADNSIPLSQTLFDHDALIFKNIRSRKLKLQHRKHGTRLTFDTGGAPVLGIWSKPGAPYVCLEPWWGFDDSSEIHPEIFARPAMLRLAPGEIFKANYQITV